MRRSRGPNGVVPCHGGSLSEAVLAWHGKLTEDVLERFTGESAVEQVRPSIWLRVFHPFEFALRRRPTDEQREFCQSTCHGRLIQIM